MQRGGLLFANPRCPVGPWCAVHAEGKQKTWSLVGKQGCCCAKWIYFRMESDKQSLGPGSWVLASAIRRPVKSDAQATTEWAVSVSYPIDPPTRCRCGAVIQFLDSAMPVPLQPVRGTAFEDCGELNNDLQSSPSDPLPAAWGMEFKPRRYSLQGFVLTLALICHPFFERSPSVGCRVLHLHLQV
ncbi:hypothetical protein BDW71DRAFT_85717 [Aspergillus fruticulosus]